MPDPFDRLLGAAAVQRGYLTAARLEEALRAHGEDGAAPPFAEWLSARGWLSPAQASELRAACTASGAALTVCGDVPARADVPRPGPLTPSPGHPAALTLVGPPTDPPRDAPTLVGAPSDAARSPTLVSGARSPATAVNPAPGAATRLGKYELLEEIGRGGMGVVYRALDTELGREVALKTLLLGDARNADQVDRLQREARTAASLDHPGIVPIYDVGMADGVPYLAMAFLHGRTLDRAIRESTLRDPREKARLALEIARAVGHAHAHRVIHRDIKPSNVLIDAAGGVHVMDFGLARRLDDGAQITAAGQVVGTPQYMSPEQIDGDREGTGPASDVYSIGAVLYEMLTGRPPFTGATFAEIVAGALRNDPVPPRTLDRGIHADLETICLKCLDKEPHRRYPAGDDLARDLERYRNGEPIEARPATWATQTMRRVVRYKALASLGAVALLAASGAAWMAHQKVGMQARMAAEVREKTALQDKVRAELREKAALYLDAALALRRAGVSMQKAEQDYLPRLRRAVEDAERVDPTRAEPHCHLGRLCRALMRFDEARAAQDRALEKEPAYAPARYERAVLAARAYGDRLVQLREAAIQREGARLAQAGMFQSGADQDIQLRIPNDEQLEQDDPKAVALRRCLTEDLAALAQEAARADRAETDRLPAAQLACARGLELAYGPDPAAQREQARARLEEALRADPSLEEAYDALGRIEEAARDWGAVARVFDRGVAVDRGYVPFWRGLGVAHHHLAEEREVRGEDGTANVDAAANAFSTGLALSPGDVGLWTERGGLKQFHAMVRFHRGQDGEPEGRAAAADLEKAVALDPASTRAWILHANTCITLANILQARGRDPEPEWRRALDDLAEAIRIEPKHSLAWKWRAGARMNWALYDSARGQDPEARYAGAVADFDKAIELDPLDYFGWEHRGNTRLNWGNHLQARGRDPSELYARAIEDFRRAIPLNPHSWGAWSSLGLTLTNAATWNHEHGRDDTEAMQKEAMESFRHALEINPANAQTCEHLGIAHMNRTNLRRDRGEDPRPGYGEAIAFFDRALALNPKTPSTWLYRAWLHAQCGTYAAERGDDPQPSYRRADADYEQAARLNPGLADIGVRRGSLRLNWGGYASNVGQDPEPHYREGIVQLDWALSVHPTLAEAWRLRGGIFLNWAGVKGAKGEDPEPLFRDAIASYGKAVGLNPGSAQAWMERAMTRMNWATARQGKGEDPETQYGEAAGDYGKALELNPHLAEAWRYLGALRLNWATWRAGRGGDARELMEQAIADLGRAVDADPSAATAWSFRGAARTIQAERERLAGGDGAATGAAALADFEEALRRNPRDAETWFLRGQLHYVLARWDEALADFGHAIEIHPGYSARTEKLRAEAERKRQEPDAGR